MDLRAELRLPVAVSEYCEAQNRERKSRWPKVKTGLQIVGIASAATLAILTFLTLQEVRKQTPKIAESADAAKESADLASKQLEAVDAAVIEPLIPTVQLPIPITMEIRFAPKNDGHVIARDLKLGFSVALQDATTGSVIGKPLLQKQETIPALPPTGPQSTWPNLIYSITINESLKRRLELTECYVTVKGRFSYDNGFRTRLGDEFCYAYIWGNNKFGRWTGPCDQAATQIRLAKKLNNERTN
jgi:hypothetical protein